MCVEYFTNTLSFPCNSRSIPTNNNKPTAVPVSATTEVNKNQSPTETCLPARSSKTYGC
jgi:hypothetical protein